MKTDVTKQKYLRPAIAVFDMMEDKFLAYSSFCRMILRSMYPIAQIAG